MRSRRASMGRLVFVVVATGALGACSFGGSDSTSTTLSPIESTEWKTIPTTSTTLSPTGPAANVPVGEQTYTIQVGDYPFKIAGLFSCASWDEIAAYNDLDPDPNKFPLPDTQILIPATCGAEATTTTLADAATETATTAAGPTTTLPAGQAEYTIQANDTLSGIATNFDTTMDKIIQINGWSDGTSHVLIPGKKIKIPVG